MMDKEVIQTIKKSLVLDNVQKSKTVVDNGIEFMLEELATGDLEGYDLYKKIVFRHFVKLYLGGKITIEA